MIFLKRHSFSIIFTAILAVAIFFRLYHLTSLPPSLFSDEVDIGYQAQILNQNGTDYFGNKLPVHFHSFSDYQPGIGIYLTSIFEKITGNPDLSVRLPSALFGILVVILLYLITKSPIIGFLAAISPWAIHYSRTGFAVSGMLSVILLGIYLWLKYLSSYQRKYLFLSLVSFCLSPYFYSTANLFLFFIPILLYLVWHQSINKISSKTKILLLLTTLVMIGPLIKNTLKGQSGHRFSYIGIFTMPHREQVVDNFRYQDALVNHPQQIGVATAPSSYFFHNKYQLIFQRFIDNYAASFSSYFLLLRGDANARHGFGNHGLVYFIDGFFIFIGLISVFRKKDSVKLATFFLYFLILSPVPFALTRDSDSPHATRLILMLPSLLYFSCQGIKYVISRYRLLKLPVIILYLLSFVSFWHYYYYHYPQDSAMAWHTGIKKTVQATNNLSAPALIFSDSYEPFLPFFLLYHPYNLLPNSSIADHISQVNNTSFSGKKLDQQFYFGHINWSDLSQFAPNTIFIVPKSEYQGVPNNHLTTIQLIKKTYVNQEEFYLLRL